MAWHAPFDKKELSFFSIPYFVCASTRREKIMACINKRDADFKSIADLLCSLICLHFKKSDGIVIHLFIALLFFFG